MGKIPGGNRRKNKPYNEKNTLYLKGSIMDRNDYTTPGYLAARSIQAGQTLLALTIVGWVAWTVYDMTAEIIADARESRAIRKNQN